ncbi:MAG: squalene--hopene cyclase, partial [Desulfoferrobacter sp.]
MIPGTRKRESRAVFLDNEEKRENSGAIHGNPSYAPLCHASAYTEEDYIDQQRGFGTEGGVRQGTTQSVWIHQIEKTVQKCCRHFLESQHVEGYWCAELESNVTITSEYIMLLHLLGIVNPEVQKTAVKYLYNEQLANGAWGLYYGDEGNLSITVEAYFALKLAG